MISVYIINVYIDLRQKQAVCSSREEPYGFTDSLLLSEITRHYQHRVWQMAMPHPVLVMAELEQFIHDDVRAETSKKEENDGEDEFTP